jgi:hypothetical protein
MSTRGLTEFLVFAILLAAAAFCFFHAWGCSQPREPELPGYCASEHLYTLALLRCVDDAKTIEESRACRQDVNKACGITEVETRSAR